MSSDAARIAAALADRYRIERELGVGGMATVYLAHDLKHDRDVAIKVLHPELAAALGSERFLSEIKTTARLQHPHILPLLDSGDAGGFLFYAMPYIAGETLRARLAREGQLPIDDALRIAREVADALGSAHALGVIHRDIKPENILLHGGHALVADFGISLAVQQAGGHRMTQTGLSLGTPQYMSPEQAMGEKSIDLRSDLYALGAVTYEMLAGEPPFTGPSVQAIVARVLTEEPRGLLTQRKSVPPAIEHAVMRALEKLPADRFATARAYSDALEVRGATTTSAAYQSSAQAAVGRPSSTRELAAWSLVAVMAAWFGWQYVRQPKHHEAPVVRVNFDLPSFARVNDGLTGTTIAVSPRGDMIGFTSTGVGNFRMYVRRVNELAAREVAEAAGRNLVFSPDGRWLAFTEGNVLKKISVDGGQVATVGTTGGAVPYGLAWSEADTIYVGSFSGMWALPAAGGSSVMVSSADSGTLHTGKRWPLVLPGGKAIAFASGSSSSDTPHLAVLTIGSAKTVVFETVVAVPLGLLGDQFVYVSPAGGLMAIRFDNATHRPTGAPIQLDDGVLMDPTAGAKASLSASGTLAYMRGRNQFQVVLADARSATSSALIREPGSYSTPRFSPDGERVAMTVFSNGAADIWIYHILRNTFTRLTTEGVNLRPEWTADGQYVVFISTRGDRRGIWRQAADGSKAAELVYQPEFEPYEAIISPDMKWLVFRTGPGAKYSRDILAVSLTGADRTVVPLVTSPYTESQPRLSPDGKWLAYQSNETGRNGVYVRRFPGGGARVQVSDSGGTEPIWGRSGRSLYIRGALGEVAQVSVTTGAEFSIGARSVVLQGDYLTDASHANYDVAPDGRFLMLKRVGAESQTIVVHNWGRELREKTAARKQEGVAP